MGRMTMPRRRKRHKSAAASRKHSPGGMGPLQFLASQAAGKQEQEAAPAYAGRLLRFGSRGEDVRQAQALLNRHGHGLAEDGIFGPLTHQAVIRFQQTEGLMVDGIIGPQTWGALCSAETVEGKDEYSSNLQEEYGRVLTSTASMTEVQNLLMSVLGGLGGGFQPTVEFASFEGGSSANTQSLDCSR